MARVLILGGGLIGAGWAAAFAGVGHEAIVADPDPGAAARVAQAWQAAQPARNASAQPAFNPFDMLSSLTPPAQAHQPDAPAAPGAPNPFSMLQDPNMMSTMLQTSTFQNMMSSMVRAPRVISSMLTKKRDAGISPWRAGNGSP